MIDEVLESLSIPGERKGAPPDNVWQEIDNARRSEPKGAGWPSPAESQLKTIELTNPYKGNPLEPAWMQSVESPVQQQNDRPERRYDTSSVETALAASARTGLPLVVAVGESWCPHCQHMEKGVWPKVEGAGRKAGSMEGKAVFLHIDYDQSRKLEGQAGATADTLTRGVDAFPTIRVFNVKADGQAVLKQEQVGELSQPALEKFLKSNGLR